jgi:hypothetical protein
MSNKLRKAVIAGAALCALVPSAVVAAASPASAGQPAYQPEMVAALARTLGVDERAALSRLEREDSQRDRKSVE